MFQPNMPNIFMNQPNNFANFGGNLNNLNIPRNNQMKFMCNQNIMNQQAFINPNLMMPMGINFNQMGMPIQNNKFMFNNNFNNFMNNNIEISLNFRFMANPQLFTVKAKQNEKLIDVINRFKQNQCPNELKNCLDVCACKGNRADKNKSLIELGINNGEIILFVENNINNNTQTVYKETKKNEYILTEKEKIQYDKLKSQYETRIMIKRAFKNRIVTQTAAGGNNTNNEEEPLQTFSEFMKEVDNDIGIIAKEHKHILVYCLTINDWKCNICNENNTKDKGKYYCSVCDYNMCEKCHEKNKYFIKKSFPQGTKPSNSNITEPFLNTDYHEHKLVFCRASKKFEFFNGWNCNNCMEGYDNDIWLYFCSLCDYNLCLRCCGYQ